MNPFDSPPNFDTGSPGLSPLIKGMTRADTLDLDLSATNAEVAEQEFPTPDSFQQWLDAALEREGKRWAIGGYNEHRVWYQRHPEHYGLGEEARCIHLGIDLWAPAGTEILAPLGGRVDSFANNAGAGNYGPTLIMEH